MESEVKNATSTMEMTKYEQRPSASKRKKTNAERCREKRERKKSLKPTKPKKSNADYQREYRARKKTRHEGNSYEHSSAPANIQLFGIAKPKSNAERQREFRARKKIRNDFDESPENDELQTKKRIQFKQSHLRNVQIVDGVYQELNNDRDDSLRERQSECMDVQQSRNGISDRHNITYNPHQRINKDRCNESNKNFGIFGHSCSVCNQLWFKDNLKVASTMYEDILRNILPNFTDCTSILLCSACRTTLEHFLNLLKY